VAASTTVAITDSDLNSREDEQILSAAGLRTVRLEARNEEQVIAGLSELLPAALIVQWAPVTPAVLDAAPACRFICRLGIGYDMIDVAAATARGVAVANVPDYCVQEVVAHTLAMALSLLRGLGQLDAAVRAGQWSASTAYPLAATPADTILGVVGLGRIGSKVAAQARALGFDVIAHDPYAVPNADARLTSLEELLSAAHVVSLHAPLTPQTRHLMRADTIALMRPGALLINTCRGGLIDEMALAGALAAGQIGGAALDVFEAEPLQADSPLRSLPNVLLSPHAAWYSPASLARLPRQAAQQVVDFLEGRTVAAILNPRFTDHLAGRPSPV
jgi:D-3-phosphoglycerate dehydrogenase / 2-oxoglutarate reductase